MADKRHTIHPNYGPKHLLGGPQYQLGEKGEIVTCIHISNPPSLGYFSSRGKIATADLKMYPRL